MLKFLGLERASNLLDPFPSSGQLFGGFRSELQSIIHKGRMDNASGNYFNTVDSLSNRIKDAGFDRLIDIIPTKVTQPLVHGQPWPIDYSIYTESGGIAIGKQINLGVGPYQAFTEVSHPQYPHGGLYLKLNSISPITDELMVKATDYAGWTIQVMEHMQRMHIYRTYSTCVPEFNWAKPWLPSFRFERLPAEAIGDLSGPNYAFWQTDLVHSIWEDRQGFIALATHNHQVACVGVTVVLLGILSQCLASGYIKLF